MSLNPPQVGWVHSLPSGGGLKAYLPQLPRSGLLDACAHLNVQHVMHLHLLSCHLAPCMQAVWGRALGCGRLHQACPGSPVQIELHSGTRQEQVCCMCAGLACGMQLPRPPASMHTLRPNSSPHPASHGTRPSYTRAHPSYPRTLLFCLRDHSRSIVEVGA